VVENRAVLQSFFATLKSLDPFIHFQLVTGVSKFARTALFSGANQLRDISLSPDFSALLGYTKSEIQTAFAPHLEVLAQKKGYTQDKLWEKITMWYNGYSWGGPERVYNPFSIGMLFTEMEFRQYWATQGTPSWLLRLLKPEDLKGIRSSSFSSFSSLCFFLSFSFGVFCLSNYHLLKILQTN
jgi:hypothetical protein